MPGLMLDGWRVGLGHKGTWGFGLAGVERGVAVGAILLSRKLVKLLIRRLKSRLKGIGYSFALQIKSSSSCFHSTSIFIKLLPGARLSLP